MSGEPDIFRLDISVYFNFIANLNALINGQFRDLKFWKSTFNKLIILGLIQVSVKQVSCVYLIMRTKINGMFSDI